MSQRPALKLKFTSSQAPRPDPQETPTSTSTPKIKLKFGGSTQSVATPQSTSSTAAPNLKPVPKSSRKPKPTPKKRALEADSGSDSDPPANNTGSVNPPIKKLKLNTRAPSGTPIVRLKAKGRPPIRPVGVGYDSEADDCEIDPTIDDDFILRMQPGEDCDYLRKAVAEKNFGPRSQGGADVRMRFLTKDGRRAVVTIRGRHYAACLVDLPCVIEAMKSWDKKGWWKSADVCQMLLVLGRVNKEEEALTFPLPTKKGELDEKTWQWAHGITPPMRWVRKRRFRKRISVRAVEEDEEEVERLLQADEECEPGSSTYIQIATEDLDREHSAALGDTDSEDYDAEQDADGDLDDQQSQIFETAPAAAAESDEDLEAHFEREMEKGLLDDHAPAPIATGLAVSSSAPIIPADPASTPASTTADTPSAIRITTTTTPQATMSSPSAADDDDEDDETEESDEDAPPSAIDDDLLERQQDAQRQREEISDLEAAIAREEERLTKTGNAILRMKIGRTIAGLRGDLQLKRGGGGGDGD